MNVIEEFITLVKISSPSKEEGGLAKYLKKRLTELGAEVVEDQSAVLTGSNTGNLVATYPGNKDLPVILFAAHMDTVASTEGMIPQIKDGIIYSDGKTILGADDKAGIAIILATLSKLREVERSEHAPLEILLTVQEEVGLIGVKNLTYPLQAQYGYVLDGDGPVGTLVNASPSHVTLDITVEGKAAHAGLAPENGINAIVVAAEAIAGTPSGRLDEETTSNFGIINGGKARNIVADQVEIKAEVRSRNRDQLEAETNKIIQIFQETARRHQASVVIKQELAYEAFDIAPNHPVVTKAAQAGEILGIDVRLKATGGGLDANILNARGIPCLALGLGNEHPHTKDELVSIHEMEKAVEFMRSILKAKS